MKTILIRCIDIYRSTVALMGIGGQCRFYPSCSRYGQDAIEKKGVLPGCWLIIKRIFKCHPFHPGGCDFVE